MAPPVKRPATHAEPGKARIILLNGASSAGKSTLSKAIQQALDEPFQHLASDYLALGLPERRDSHGPFLWWGNLRPRFFDGFHRAIAAVASAGNDLIVEHIIEFPQRRADLRRLLQPFDVFLVGVTCSIEELERRERQRGDRRIGEGRSHLEDNRIHDFGPYDFQIETTGREPTHAAAEVVERWRARSSTVL